MFQLLFTGELIKPYLIGVFVIVLVIYAFDKLFDFRLTKFNVRTKVLIALFLAVFILFLASEYIGIKIHVLPPSIPLFGLIGIVAMLLYYYLSFNSLKRKIQYYPKELIIAAVYTYGVAVYPIIVRSEALTGIEQVVVFEFFLAVLINVLLFSILDFTKDTENRAVTFATKYGLLKTKRLIAILLLVGILLIGIILPVHFLIALSFMGMLVMCSLVLFRPFSSFIMNAFMLDLAFLWPMLYVLFRK